MPDGPGPGINWLHRDAHGSLPGLRALRPPDEQSIPPRSWAPWPEGLPLDRTVPRELSNDPLEDAMTKSPLEQSGWSRRRFIQASTAAAGLGLMPRRASAQAAPWAVGPPGNPSNVTFVVWQYGNIYSLNLRFIPAVKAFNAGQHVYLGTLHHYYLSLVNDQAQSPIAGKGRTL